MKIEDIKLVEIVTHFCKGDSECMEDYALMEIFIDDSLAASYDHNEDGYAKSDGFLSALKFLGADFGIKRIDIADFDC